MYYHPQDIGEPKEKCAKSEYRNQAIRPVLYDAGYHDRNVRKKPFIGNTNKQKS